MGVGTFQTSETFPNHGFPYRDRQFIAVAPEVVGDAPVPPCTPCGPSRYIVFFFLFRGDGQVSYENMAG